MYSRKSVRPRIEPWGAPALTGYFCKDFPSRATLSGLLGQAKLIFYLAYVHMSTLCSTWNIFFHFFLHETIYFGIYSLFIFSLVFFFYCLFITSILGNKQKLWCLQFFIYESRATMCESMLKISIFTFFLWYIIWTLLHRGLFETKKKTFLFNSMLIYFLLYNW